MLCPFLLTRDGEVEQTLRYDGGEEEKDEKRNNGDTDEVAPPQVRHDGPG